MLSKRDRCNCLRVRERGRQATSKPHRWRKKRYSWCCMVLSSGERTIGTAMQEGGHKVKAGQSMRLLDIPIGRRFGAFDKLHGFKTGSIFSDAIKRAASTHYGHPGREFLEKLTRDKRDFCQRLERIKALPAFSIENGEGQDKRAAGRFALLALAGELKPSMA